MNDVLSRALTMNSVTPPNKNNTVAVTLGTSEGDPYTLQGIADLLRTNWVSITNFNGTAGTNMTALQLPSTNNIFTNPAVFFRAEYNFQ